MTELTLRLQRELEPKFRRIEVRGEVISARALSSGHLYFTLRDESAQLPCVIWRSTLARMPQKLSDGQKIVATGDLSIHPPQGRYQLIVSRVADIGLGDELLRLEELKRQLMAEGLFDPDRKRPLPALPRRIGLVTAVTGAAIHDFIVTARSRFACDIVVCACRVQGELAARSIAGAIRVVGSWPGVELVVVTRGGGSALDLLPFSDERVVRQVASCPVPVVSAVGHEIDVSLADLAADLRAMTPTAAAERVLPNRAELTGRLRALEATLLHRIERRLGESGQRLELASLRANDAMARRLSQLRRRLLAVRDRLERAHPRVRLLTQQARLAATTARLGRARERLLDRLRERLELARERLRLLSPQASLDRGWALVRREDLRLVRALADVSPGGRIAIAVTDGVIHATVDLLEPAKPLQSPPTATLEPDEEHR